MECWCQVSVAKPSILDARVLWIRASSHDHGQRAKPSSTWGRCTNVQSVGETSHVDHRAIKSQSGWRGKDRLPRDRQLAWNRLEQVVLGTMSIGTKSNVNQLSLWDSCLVWQPRCSKSCQYRAHDHFLSWLNHFTSVKNPGLCTLPLQQSNLSCSNHLYNSGKPRPVQSTSATTYKQKELIKLDKDTTTETWIAYINSHTTCD